MSLIDRFVSEECDAYVRGAIQDVVSSGTGRAVLEFNVLGVVPKLTLTHGAASVRASA